MHKTFWALRADLQASDVTVLSSTMRRVVQQLRIHASNEMLMKVAAYEKKNNTANNKDKTSESNYCHWCLF